jgi:hypothetical protein
MVELSKEYPFPNMDFGWSKKNAEKIQETNGTLAIGEYMIGRGEGELGEGKEGQEKVGDERKSGNW